MRPAHERWVRGPLELSQSTELPRIRGDRAKAFTKAGYYRGVQRLRRTSRGWRIDLYDAMVHH